MDAHVSSEICNFICLRSWKEKYQNFIIFNKDCFPSHVRHVFWVTIWCKYYGKKLACLYTVYSFCRHKRKVSYSPYLSCFSTANLIIFPIMDDIHGVSNRCYAWVNPNSIRGGGGIKIPFRFFLSSHVRTIITLLY